MASSGSASASGASDPASAPASVEDMPEPERKRLRRLVLTEMHGTYEAQRRALATAASLHGTSMNISDDEGDEAEYQ